MAKKPNPDTPCARCGYAQHKHALVNYADGPLVGETALVCPTSIYAPDVKHG